LATSPVRAGRPDHGQASHCFDPQEVPRPTIRAGIGSEFGYTAAQVPIRCAGSAAQFTFTNANAGDRFERVWRAQRDRAVSDSELVVHPAHAPRLLSMFRFIRLNGKFRMDMH